MTEGRKTRTAAEMQAMLPAMRERVRQAAAANGGTAPLAAVKALAVAEAAAAWAEAVEAGADPETVAAAVRTLQQANAELAAETAPPPSTYRP
ncbi:hypothetical protein [Siccirubricoccus phaeus]|uniref:hypothetical protein n=1 Tax=Siccirubricoccus phaeus TaxID=2595053 RepID=UPI0011F1C498|nr:hypothetical protein [Siccirubricoccus phaeus]